MLYIRFLLLLVITSADHYSSMNDIYPTFYVRSSCALPIFILADTNDDDVE